LAQDIMLEIQSFDYEVKTFDQLKANFVEICDDHLTFNGYFIKNNDAVGKLLVKNGNF